MLVSVIIPVYNVEAYIRECLESVLAQTYKELEIVIVDDGSTDSSGKICDEYAQKYKNVMVIHKENAGLGMARNTGLENMHGDYVMFLDSDDYIEPTCVHCLMESILKNHVDMCKGSMQRVTDDKRILSVGKHDNEIFEGKGAKEILLPRMISSLPDKKDYASMCVWGAIYSCLPIKQHQIRFHSERELINEDLVFNIDYMQYADGACLTEEIIYNYRLNMNSLTTKYREDRFEAVCFFYITVRDKLIKLGYDDTTILRLKTGFLINIRGAIQQENRKTSGKSFSNCIKRIKEICSDNVVVEVIHSFPMEKLGVPQKVFLWLINRKAAAVLYVSLKLLR